jgi:hypothetical protein
LRLALIRVRMARISGQVWGDPVIRVVHFGRSTFCSGMAAALMAIAVAVPAAPAAAAPPAASGSVSCNIAGMGKFGPQLTAPGTVTHLKIKFNGKSTNCTSAAGAGGAVVNIQQANFKGAGKLVDPATGLWNGCNDFTNFDQIGFVKMKISWVSTPPIAPSIVTYTSGTSPLVSNNAGSDRLNFPTGASITITGSFATATNAIMTHDTAIPNACTATWGPVPTYNFGSTSILSIF